MTKGVREAFADWMMVLAAPLLGLSLFLTWSHQFSASFESRYSGTAILRGIPRNPNAWQVYSVADVFLAVVAVGLLAVALRGGPVARLVVALAAAIAIAFTLHALSVPPTNGANLFDPTLRPPGYTPNSPGSGAGEIVALIALGLGLGGLLVSFTAD
ncbi:MAG: hypothetical protein WAK93_21560 [Solirubrobacteraceae bacterium]